MDWDQLATALFDVSQKRFTDATETAGKPGWEAYLATAMTLGDISAAISTALRASQRANSLIDHSRFDDEIPF